MPSAAYRSPRWQRHRELLLARNAAHPEPCPRCGRLMLAHQDLDMGHLHEWSLTRRTDFATLRLEHAHCNRSAGSKFRGAWHRGELAKPTHTRAW